jgi:hypothetical protein
LINPAIAVPNQGRCRWIVFKMALTANAFWVAARDLRAQGESLDAGGFGGVV